MQPTDTPKPNAPHSVKTEASDKRKPPSKERERNIRLARRVHKALQCIRSLPESQKQIYASRHDIKPIDFMTTKDLIIHPGKPCEIPMTPCQSTQLQDRLFKFEMHPSFARHKSIQVIDTINDYYNMNAVCYNITSSPYSLPKHTVIVTAHTLTRETLPELHIQGEVLLSAVTALPLEQSPKQLAEDHFSQAMNAYNQHPDLQAILREFKSVFVQPEEFRLPKLKMEKYSSFQRLYDIRVKF